jgi:type II secretory pathway pseudopilin PulG
MSHGRQLDLRDGRGYTLVGLLIAVAVVNVALGVAATSWVTLDQRAREAELIWRGEQIAQAIECHGATEASEPLETLEQLVDSNCLRRLYRDPMVKDGKWRILRQSELADGTIAALLGQTMPGEEGDQPVSLGSQDGTALQGGTGLQGTRRIEPPRLQRIATGVSGGDAIIGVMSTKTGASLRLYGQNSTYERWIFLIGGAADQGTAGPNDPSGNGAAEAPGAGGTGQPLDGGRARRGQLPRARGRL